VVGLGVHVIPGILTVVPGSTFVIGRVTVVPVWAGLGLIVQIVGSVGPVLSTISPVVDPVFVFPAGSVIVMVSFGIDTSQVPVHTVQVHVTSPLASAGLGVHVMFGILTEVPSSTHVRLVVIVVPLFAGFGFVVAVGVAGAVSSTVTS